MKKVTIVDISKELGVSTSMVSMVLSGNGPKNRISKNAINKVLDTAKLMGYNPNLLARALRTGKTGVIGLIVADISNPFFAMIARLVENHAFEKGYDVMFASSDENLEKFITLGNAFITRQVDGLIITPVIDSHNIISEWNSQGMPIVSIDRHIESLNTPYAVTDNFNACNEMLNFVTRKGYKKIAFIGKHSNLTSFTDREDGFLQGVKSHQLTSDDYTIFKLDYYKWEDEMQELIKNILVDKYDIIFFSQNMLGIKGLKILNSMNIRIPKDIAIISFDNPEVYEFNKPQITCFEQPLETLTKKALYYLMQMIDGELKEKPPFEKFKGRLIIRGSC